MHCSIGHQRNNWIPDGVYDRMKIHWRTASLVVAALLLFAWDIHQTKHPHPQYGLPVLLSHTCSWQESFNQIGDDRQIIVTKSDPASVEINHMRFDEAGLRKEFALIYQTRNERLAWFQGDTGISYGDAVRVVGDMYQSGFHPAIALLSPNDETFYTAKASSVGPCPFSEKAVR
jgi:hypothetical protein